MSVRFLGPSLSFMLVYVWARKNPYTNLSFLGVFNFTAPFLPWVLLAFSVMLGGSPLVDLLGMLAGATCVPICRCWVPSQASLLQRGCVPPSCPCDCRLRSFHIPRAMTTIHTPRGTPMAHHTHTTRHTHGTPPTPTGHVYYYLEDVYPRISGRRPLSTPGLLKALFPGEARAQPAIRPLVEQQGAHED